MHLPSSPGRRAALGLAVTLTAVTALHSQTVRVDPPTAGPGDAVIVRVTNDTGQPFFFPRSCGLRVLRHTGELVSNGLAIPGLPTTLLPGQVCDSPRGMLPGQFIDIPLLTPTEPGSYTVVFVWGNRGAARLNIVAPAADARQLSVYPSTVRWPQRAHAHDFTDPTNTTWEVANVGTEPHTFGPGDRLELRAPGSGLALATLDLDGVTVRGGGVTSVALPSPGLAEAPYEVYVTYDDPGVGRRVVTTNGIRPLGARVELHLLGGQDITRAKPLEMGASLTDFAASSSGDPLFLLMLGLAPGTSPLPGGITLPLALDGVAVESARSGLFGLLSGSAGSIPNIYPEGFPFYEAAVSGIALRHPGLPALSGLQLRVAVLAVDTEQTTWGASQPGRITFQ
ncbi:MAG: hypothetical protein AAF628_18695 [Planctomycetota bacterium]